MNHRDSALHSNVNASTLKHELSFKSKSMAGKSLLQSHDISPSLQMHKLRKEKEACTPGGLPKAQTKANSKLKLGNGSNFETKAANGIMIGNIFVSEKRRSSEIKMAELILVENNQTDGTGEQ